MKTLLALLFSLISSQAATYYVSSGGSASANGTDPSTPWSYTKAFTFTGYANNDVVNLMDNYFPWSFMPNFGRDLVTGRYLDSPITYSAQVGGGNTVTWQPYRKKVVVIACSKFLFSGITGNHIFKDLNFTAFPTLANHKTDAVERLQFMDGSISLTAVQFVNCHFRATPQAIGNMTVNVRGCLFHGVGATEFEHGYYGGGGSANKIIGNVFIATGGEAIKYAPTSTSTGATIDSNIVINPGTFASPAGHSYGVLLGPGSVSTTGLLFRDNVILSDPLELPTTLDYPIFMPAHASTAISDWTITGNRIEGPDATIFKFGTGSGATCANLNISGNTFGINNSGTSLSRSLFYIFASQTTPTIDNNSYYNKGSTTARWQYPDGVNYTTIAAWKSGTSLDAASTFTGNSYPPDAVIIRRNYDDAGRANIVVINHALATTVSGVPTTGLGLTTGDDFVVENVSTMANFDKWFSTQVYTYDGNPISFTVQPQITGQLGDPYLDRFWGVPAGNPQGSFFYMFEDWTKPVQEAPRYTAYCIIPAPKRPISPSISSPQSGLVRISWTIPSGTDFQAFAIWRKRSFDIGFAQINAVPFTADHYDDLTAQPGTTYQYKVQTFSVRTPNASFTSELTYATANAPDPNNPGGGGWIPGSNTYDPARVIIRPNWWSDVESLPLDP